MRKLHLLIIGITLVILLGSLVYGALHLYTKQNTVPPGTKVGGLELGGRSIQEALRMLDDDLAIVAQERVMYKFDNFEVQLTWGESGVTVDAAGFRTALAALIDSEISLLERAKARYHFAKNWGLEVELDQQVLKQMFSPAWEQEQFGAPVNAVRTIDPNDNVRYLPGHSAIRIQWPSLVSRIMAAVPSDLPVSKERPMVIIRVPLRVTPPQVTIQSLQREGIRRKIVQFSTGLGRSGEGRVHNVTATAQSLNGMVLAPGDIFDYAKVVSHAERVYGFREAPVIYGGKFVPGVGGGICQVSSTLYNAAIRTGLEIVERRNHSVPVSYLPKGQDATFAKGYINFSFKNNTGHHLLIHAEVKDRLLIVKLFGDMPEGLSYEIASLTAKMLPPPRRYVQSRTVPEGGERVILKGKPGYVVETYRTKRMNGRDVETSLLTRDTYPPQPALIAVRRVPSGGADGGAGGGSGGETGGPGMAPGIGKDRSGTEDSAGSGGSGGARDGDPGQGGNAAKQGAGADSDNKGKRDATGSDNNASGGARGNGTGDSSPDSSSIPFPAAPNPEPLLEDGVLGPIY